MTTLIQLITRLPMQSFMTVTLGPIFFICMAWARGIAWRHWQ